MPRAETAAAKEAAVLSRGGGTGRFHQRQYIEMGLLGGPEQGSPSRVVQNFRKLVTQRLINVNMLFTS